jgi:hypothetical protein
VSLALTSRVLRITAAAGLALVAIMAGRAAGIPALVLMLGPGVVVPLGLSIALDPASSIGAGSGPLPARALTFAAPIGAAAGVLGWYAPPGHRGAIACAVLHAIVCGLAGLLGLARLWSRRGARFGPLREIAIDVGLLFLPVAAAWFFASRAAMPLIGFQEPVVTFTAAHFHYAGFAAPTIIGGVGRLLHEAPEAGPGWRRLYRIAAAVVCMGVPLTAIGIATNHTVESVSAVLLAAGMLAASSILVLAASRRAAARSKLAAALFIVSGATLLLTMSLAATFALTSSAGRGSSLHGAVPLQTMIDYHGGSNAIGFALAGLTALALLAAKRQQP